MLTQRISEGSYLSCSRKVASNASRRRLRAFQAFTYAAWHERQLRWRGQVLGPPQTLQVVLTGGYERLRGIARATLTYEAVWRHDRYTMAVKDQVPDKYSRSAQNGGLGGDSEQLAAKLAAELVPRAVEVLGEVLEKPTRGSGSQLGAARLIFELSAKLAPQVDAGKPRGELRLIDAAKAAELLQKRLEQK